MQLTDWLLVEVAPLLKGLTHPNLFDKIGFIHPSVKESPFRLQPHTFKKYTAE
jgi:hypothetical protein